jgi:hypothetical protein
MARYIFVVHSNAVEGREQEYNEWYSNRHLDDVLACTGVTAARRLVLADQQIRAGSQPFNYLALYEIETDNPQIFFDELSARIGTEHMPRSAALGDVLPILWKVL